jgi:sulfur-carrier protein
MIRVYLPSQLDSYTDGLREIAVEYASAHTLADLLATLDDRFPGVRFRVVDEQGNIRRHIAMFVGAMMVKTLDTPLSDNDRVQIVGALSGG